MSCDASVPCADTLKYSCSQLVVVLSSVEQRNEVLKDVM